MSCGIHTTCFSGTVTFRSVLMTPLRCLCSRLCISCKFSPKSTVEQILKWSEMFHFTALSVVKIIQGRMQTHESEYGILAEWYWQGKPNIPGDKPVPVPLCQSQIPYWLTHFIFPKRSVPSSTVALWNMQLILCYWLRERRYYTVRQTNWNWKTLWNGNKCGKNKVMRISRQPPPIQIVID